MTWLNGDRSLTQKKRTSGKSETFKTISILEAFVMDVDLILLLFLVVVAEGALSLANALCFVGGLV